MTRRDEDLTFHQGNGVTIVSPVNDGDSDTGGTYLDLSNVTASDVTYRISDSYDQTTVQYDAADSDITIDNYGNTDVVWPSRLVDDGFSEPADSDDVIIVEIPASETDTLAAAADEDEPELVHELKVVGAGPDISPSTVTVFQGDVLVLASNSTDVVS